MLEFLQAKGQIYRTGSEITLSFKIEELDFDNKMAKIFLNEKQRDEEPDVDYCFEVPFVELSKNWQKKIQLETTDLIMFAGQPRKILSIEDKTVTIEIDGFKCGIDKNVAISQVVV